MALARERVVRHLIDQITGAAEDCCTADPSISADELMSAYITVTRNVLRVANNSGADPARLRAIVERLLLETGDASRPN